MIKAIVFDFGNVLITGSYADFVRNIEPFCKISAEEITALMLSSEIVDFHDSDLVNFDEYFRFFEKECEMELNKDKFLEFYVEHEPIKDMIALVNEIHKTGKYKLGLLSNLSFIGHEKILKTLDCYDAFDVIVCSHELNQGNPHKVMYETIKERLDLKPEEILFIDDKEDNLIPARKIGMETIQFIVYEDFLIELKEKGIEF